MGEANKSNVNDKGNVLILGVRDGRLAKLENALLNAYYKVYLAPGLEEAFHIYSNHYFNVILVTDTLECVFSKDFFSYLRDLFPHSKVLCLADEITDEMEVVMRSAGLVFLGPYEEFHRHFHSIFSRAIKSNQERGG